MEISYKDAVKWAAGNCVYENTKTGKKYIENHPYNLGKHDFIAVFFQGEVGGNHNVLGDIKKEFKKRLGKKK